MRFMQFYTCQLYRAHCPGLRHARDTPLTVTFEKEVFQAAACERPVDHRSTTSGAVYVPFVQGRPRPRLRRWNVRSGRQTGKPSVTREMGVYQS